MKHKGWIVAAALLGAVALVVSMLEEAADVRVPIAPAPVASPEPAKPDVPVDMSTSLATEALASPAAAGPAATESSRGCWRGRLLAPDGSPAADVPWTLQVAALHGSPNGSSGRTAPDGRFVARFDLAEGEGVQLQFDPAGASALTLSDQAPFAAMDADLGDVALEPVAVLAGSIVDAEGRPVPGEWSIYVNDRLGPPDQRPTRWFRMEDSVDAATGRFEVRGVVPGSRDVRAALKLHAPESRESVSIMTTPQQVEIGPRGLNDLVLRYEGPVLSRQLTVLVRGVGDRPCFDVAASDVVLAGPDGERCASRSELNVHFEQQLQFADVPPGSYTLEVRDAAHVPWRRNGVRPGPEPVLAELEGACTLDLQVVNAADGKPVESFGVGASIRRQHTVDLAGKPSVFTSTGRRCLADGDGKLAPHPDGFFSIDRLPADALELDVSAPGFREARASWPGTQPGCRDSLRVALERQDQLTVEGRVLEADGSPAAGAQVALYSDDEGKLPGRFVSEAEYWALDLGPNGFETSREPTYADEQGRFRIQAPWQGRCHVRAWRSSVVDAWAELDDPQAGAAVELRLPPTAELAASLVAGAAAPGRSWGLAVLSADDAALATRALPPTATSDQQGHFRFAQLRPGAWHVFGLALREGESGWQPLALHLTAAGAPGSASFDYVQSEQIPCVYLGRVELPASTLPVFDVTALGPGEVRVRTLRGSEPLANVQVNVWREGGPEPRAFVTSEDTGEDGWTGSISLVPGAYTVETLTPPLSKSAADMRRVEIAAGAALEWTVLVDLRRATLLCLDPEGHPLARAGLRIWHRDGDAWSGQYLRTDAAGRLTLELPPGELRVGRLAAGDEGLASLDQRSAFDVESVMKFTARVTADQREEQWKRDVPVSWGVEGGEVSVTLPPAPP